MSYHTEGADARPCRNECEHVNAGVGLAAVAQPLVRLRSRVKGRTDRAMATGSLAT